MRKQLFSTGFTVLRSLGTQKALYPRLSAETTKVLMKLHQSAVLHLLGPKENVIVAAHHLQVPA